MNEPSPDQSGTAEIKTTVEEDSLKKECEILQQQIDEMKKELDELRNKVDALEKENH